MWSSSSGRGTRGAEGAVWEGNRRSGGASNPAMNTMHALRSVAACTLLALAGMAGGCARSEAGEPGDKKKSHAEQLGKPDLVVRDADAELKRSRIVGLLSAPHETGVSLVWCSTMQFAWSAMENGLGEPVRVSPSEAAEGYRTSTVSTADLDAGAYVALAGFGRDGILDRIRRELAEKFGGAASPSMLPTSVGADELLAYAYLFKSLQFQEPFVRVTNTFRFGETRVKAFGLWESDRIQKWGEIARQVEVHHYASGDEWTVRLRTREPEDMLVIARRAPGATLQETIGAVLKSLEGEGDRFRSDDTLKIPLMNFDVTRRYSELEGLAVSGSNGGGLIASAKQNIRLRLDEKGAILKSEAAISVTAAPVVQEPRMMVCEGPFLMLMMRSGAAHPYFAAWIESPELLVAE